MHRGQIPSTGTGRAWLQPSLTVGPWVLFLSFVPKQQNTLGLWGSGA